MDTADGGATYFGLRGICAGDSAKYLEGDRGTGCADSGCGSSRFLVGDGSRICISSLIFPSPLSFCASLDFSSMLPQLPKLEVVD